VSHTTTKAALSATVAAKSLLLSTVAPVATDKGAKLVIKTDDKAIFAADMVPFSADIIGAASSMLGRVERLSDVDFSSSMPYLVKGWFYLGQTSLLFAPSNAGKTSLVLDLVRAITTDEDWHGNRTVKGGAVLYIAAEAPSSVYRRTVMLTLAGKKRVIVLGEPVDIVGDTDAGKKIAALVRLCEHQFRVRIRLVVFDTLTLCFGEGDENSTRDAGRAIQAAKIAASHTDAHVMLVHHTGKDRSAGARGSYALEANVDTAVELVLGEGSVLAKLKKQRDAPTDPVFTFKIVSVDLGVDEDGDPITIGGVEPAGAFVATSPTKRPDKGMEAVLAALAALTEAAPQSSGFTAAEIGDACAETFKKGSEVESRKKAVRGVLKQAIEAADALVEKEGDRFRLIPVAQMIAAA